MHKIQRNAIYGTRLSLIELRDRTVFNMIGRVVRTPQYDQMRPGEGEGPGRSRSHASGHRLYRISDILIAYSVSALVNLIALVLVPVLVILTYPMAGIYLSRSIGKSVIWWPFAANVQNISATKLHLILTWPISVPLFAWQLFIVKFL